MSADDWEICPRCLARARQAHDEKVAAVMAMYGVVPLQEFEALRAEVCDGPDRDSFVTFREDYEFYGVESGVLTISYSGHCHVCNLGLEVKEERRFFWDAGDVASR